MAANVAESGGYDRSSAVGVAVSNGGA